MAVYAIADLHLSLANDKPMDVFGSKWAGYVEKLAQNWREMIHDGDTVVVPGDISWSTYLEECEADFRFIDALPGKKIFLKGNHDYWWTTMNKLDSFVREKGFSTISFLHNGAVCVEGMAVCGTRGWVCPKGEQQSAEDEKIYRRELLRLRMSLEAAKKQFPEAPRTVFVHYPPFNKQKELEPGFMELISEFDVHRVVYGHLHADAHAYALTGTVQGVAFFLTSADFLNFLPLRLDN